MFTLWLFLSFLFTLAQAFSGPRQPTNWPQSSEAPSCEQLLAFWEILSRTAKMGQITNEIPVLPLQMYNSHDYLTMGSGRKDHHIKILKSAMDAISNHLDSPHSSTRNPWTLHQSFVPEPLLLLPMQPQASSDQDRSGMFGKFHEQSPKTLLIPNQHRTESGVLGFGSSSAVPLSAKKNDESEFYSPNWGSLDDVDSFGSFVDYDIAPPHFAITRTPKDAAIAWPGISGDAANQQSSQVACDILINTDCTMDKQCACGGTKILICIDGKCLSHQLSSDIGQEYGTWHDGPVPQSQLRLLSRLRKRSNPSIFM